MQGAFELVGVAAHDLGNPLLALQLRLQRLRAQTRENPRAQEGLALVEREARRMGLLVHDLLDLSRLSAGRLPLDLEELDLAALTREVAERFSDQATAAGSSLVVHAQGPVRGRWDRQRLDRVATNLLSNALKFGQGQPIEVHVLADGGRARLAVKDHGVGLPANAQERLFGRFERLGDTGRPGSGLGLYIVHQLVAGPWRHHPRLQPPGPRRHLHHRAARLSLPVLSPPGDATRPLTQPHTSPTESHTKPPKIDLAAR